MSTGPDKDKLKLSSLESTHREPAISDFFKKANLNGTKFKVKAVGKFANIVKQNQDPAAKPSGRNNQIKDVNKSTTSLIKKRDEKNQK